MQNYGVYGDTGSESDDYESCICPDDSLSAQKELSTASDFFSNRSLQSKISSNIGNVLYGSAERSHKYVTKPTSKTSEMSLKKKTSHHQLKKIKKIEIDKSDFSYSKEQENLKLNYNLDPSTMLVKSKELPVVCHTKLDEDNTTPINMQTTSFHIDAKVQKFQEAIPEYSLSSNNVNLDLSNEDYDLEEGKTENRCLSDGSAVAPGENHYSSNPSEPAQKLSFKSTFQHSDAMLRGNEEVLEQSKSFNKSYSIAPSFSADPQLSEAQNIKDFAGKTLESNTKIQLVPTEQKLDNDLNGVVCYPESLQNKLFQENLKTECSQTKNKHNSRQNSCRTSVKSESEDWGTRDDVTTFISNKTTSIDKISKIVDEGFSQSIANETAKFSYFEVANDSTVNTHEENEINITTVESQDIYQGVCCNSLTTSYKSKLPPRKHKHKVSKKSISSPIPRAHDRPPINSQPVIAGSLNESFQEDDACDEEWLHFAYKRQNKSFAAPRPSSEAQNGGDPAVDNSCTSAATLSSPQTKKCARFSSVVDIFSVIFFIILLITIFFVIYFQVLGDPYDVAQLFGISSSENDKPSTTHNNQHDKPTNPILEGRDTLRGNGVYLCTLHLQGVEFVEDFLLPNTTKYSSFKRELESTINSIYHQSDFNSTFRSATLLTIVNGSVLASFRLSFETGGNNEAPPVLPSKYDVIRTLEEGTCASNLSAPLDNDEKRQIACTQHFVGAYRVEPNSLGFIAEDGCSGQASVLTSPFGVVTSSNWNVSQYKPNERCEWHLKSRNDTLLQLTIDSFETEKNYDFVSIYEGSAVNRKLVGFLSGKLEKQVLLVPSNDVSITFLSDGIVQNLGFIFFYRFINDSFPSSSGCHEANTLLNASSGGFTSSGYPRLYPNNLHCQWTIKVEPAKVVKLLMVDFKTHDALDVLHIFVDKNNTTLLFESFYGTNSGREVMTDSNQVTVVFITNNALRDRGFHLQYTSEDPILCPEQHECEDGKCIAFAYLCDGTIDCINKTDEKNCDSHCYGQAMHTVSKYAEVELYSMHYPNDYEASSNCLWMIEAVPNNFVIQIELKDFSTEISYDKLSIFKGIGRNKTLLEIYTGEQSGKMTTVSSNKATVTFEGDKTVQSRGFHIIVTAMSPGVCPGSYTCGNESCIPNVWVCDGTRDCLDGRDEVRCDSNCGGLADFNKDGFITSRDYPKAKYEDNSDCIWRIKSPHSNRSVSLKFNDFSTEEKFDVLRIYEGIGRNKTLKVAFSGALIPPNYVSATSDITMTFISDGSVTDRGFNISVYFIDGGPCPGSFHCSNAHCIDWANVCNEISDCSNGKDEELCPSRCGGLRDPEESNGMFMTLYHPRYYPDNLKCIWRLGSDKNHLVQLEFLAFNTEENVDHLRIFNGIGHQKRLSGWFSGAKTPTIYRSRHHQITLDFQSDTSVNRPGFHITYRIGTPTELPACGENNQQPIALGMQTGKIRNFQITSLSTLSEHWAAYNARLNNTRAAWASTVIQPKRLQWLQVDLEYFHLLTGIATQGFFSRRSFFVTSFKICFSRDGKNWSKYASKMDTKSKIFSGNNDSTSIRYNDFDHPFVARFIRILPHTWIGSCAVMRIELFGCGNTKDLTAAQQGCNEGYFECGDGTCVPDDVVCNRFNDCQDGSDEKRCSGCRRNEFECFSKQCVSLTSRCDGTNNCDDGSDEIRCSSCKGDDFLCADESMCISSKWRCDGFKDCLDMSDEKGCNHDWLCDVSSDFRCSDGRCVSGINVMCNDVMECQDNSDELLCDCGKKITSKEFSKQVLLSSKEESSRFSRIVGGSFAEMHFWPWQVSLRRAKGGTHYCGASLIDKRWIVTAAHCLVGEAAQDVIIKCGLHYRKFDSDNTQTAEAQSIYIHPRYDSQTFDFDIALIKLKEPVNVTVHVSTVCVPPFSHVFYPDQKCWITGWGTIHEKGPMSSSLKEAEVSIMATSICNRPMWYAGKITPRMLCAGHIIGAADSCQGDSGGPLVCQGRGDGPWFLAGIVSWGYGCGGVMKPGVYTKVSEVSHWIREVMEKDPD